MKSKKPTQFRQGDVLNERVSIRPSGEQKPTASGRMILAYGEATGHAHEIANPQEGALYEITQPVSVQGDLSGLRGMGEIGLILKETGQLVHQKHAPILLPKGKYVARIQREYTPEMNRQVAD